MKNSIRKVFEAQLKVRAHPKLNVHSLATEVWREYDFGGRVYRIAAPVALYMRVGGTTHRVLDEQGVVHCVPAPGVNGCALRWLNKDLKNPVEF